MEVQKLNYTLEEITNSLDISKRVLVISPNEILFPIVSKANILFKFCLRQTDDVFALTATVCEWDDKNNCEAEMKEAEDMVLKRNEDDKEQAETINNQILCLIEEISDKIGLEILSSPEEIQQNMDCLVSFYSNNSNAIYSATCAVKLITENAGRIFRIIKGLKKQDLSINQAFNLLF